MGHILRKELYPLGKHIMPFKLDEMCLTVSLISINCEQIKDGVMIGVYYVIYIVIVSMNIKY